VTTNGQAVAAADLVIGALTQARDQFSDSSVDVSRRDAHARLDEALQDVTRYRAPMNGNLDQPVQLDAAGKPAGAWDDLYHAIKRGYGQLWAVQDVQGDTSEWQATLDTIADIAVGTVQALPQVIASAAHFTADAVGGVAKGLLPLWPLVLGAVVVVVVGGILVSQGKARGVLA
jgi:hypothetical protein